MRGFSWYLSFIIIISIKVYFVNFPRSLKSFNSVCGIISWPTGDSYFVWYCKPGNFGKKKRNGTVGIISKENLVKTVIAWLKIAWQLYYPDTDLGAGEGGDGALQLHLERVAGGCPALLQPHLGGVCSIEDIRSQAHIITC